ncbi:hypothetical protein llap_7420 [Limosa lapponica baueri]|uniref:Uncharacterized protein n=1 Tax=Limosa lapponica baueri TaxID=1758121 RepID=A0A2I0U872_LIMLA|nr:hypothetical protein llap_7420 [Limosa lapponica baueri]
MACRRKVRGGHVGPPGRVHEDGEATLVKGNLVRNCWGIFSTLKLDMPYVKRVKNYQSRKKIPPRVDFCEALVMEMRLPPVSEQSVPHTLPLCHTLDLLTTCQKTKDDVVDSP